MCQNGTFDVADRLFSSVARSWDMCTSALSEVKELTPEWYSIPDFLTNVNEFDLGNAQVRQAVSCTTYCTTYRKWEFVETVR